jgi:hypothetical protein
LSPRPEIPSTHEPVLFAHHPARDPGVALKYFLTDRVNQNKAKVKSVPNCPKCGSETSAEMAFCPKCGAPLKVQQPTDLREEMRERRREWRERRRELREQRRQAEKREKTEKNEKYEKRETYLPSFIGPLIGGVVVLFLGLVFYFTIAGSYQAEVVGAAFFVIVGLIVIAAAIYAATAATRRHPAT